MLEKYPWTEGMSKTLGAGECSEVQFKRSKKKRIWGFHGSKLNFCRKMIKN